MTSDEFRRSERAKGVQSFLSQGLGPTVMAILRKQGTPSKTSHGTLDYFSGWNDCLNALEELGNHIAGPVLDPTMRPLGEYKDDELPPKLPTEFPSEPEPQA